MTSAPFTFDEMLTINGWSLHWLSRHLQVKRTTLQRIKNNQLPCPDNLYDWMAEHTRHMLSFDKPRNWQEGKRS
jgi:hypothetical protein